MLFRSQVGFAPRGRSGIEVSDWWPHLAGVVDDLCFVRDMWTTDNDHAAENQIHTGRHRLDEPQPSIGSWASYGLGSLNDDLPRYVVLGGPTRSDTRQSIDSLYLGPQHAGVPSPSIRPTRFPSAAATPGSRHASSGTSSTSWPGSGRSPPRSIPATPN